MPMWAYGIWATVIGLCFGSFANVVAVRLKEHSSIWGRSRCPGCLVTIKAHHLVPIVSWVWLRGRCATCAKKIHPSYPVVEALMALFAFVAFFRHPEAVHGEVGGFLFELGMAFVLLVAATFDARWQLLPLEFLGASGAFFAVWNFWSGRLGWESLVLGVGFGSGFFLLQYVLSRGRWIGIGDVWFGGFIGAVLGSPLVWISFYLTYLAGGFVALVLLASGIAKRDSRIAFGPMLAFGVFGALWFGEKMLAFLHDLLAR